MNRADPTAIYNWLCLSERITTSGQPSEAQLAEIRKLGVQHIINLGPHDHEYALPDEAASVAELNMEYVYIPVDFKNPTNKDFGQFCEAMEELSDQPVHVHCIANYRVSAFFERWHREIRGMDAEQARNLRQKAWQEPDLTWRTFIG